MLKMLAGQFHLKRCGDQVTIESTANFGTLISDESNNVVFFSTYKRVLYERDWKGQLQVDFPQYVITCVT